MTLKVTHHTTDAYWPRRTQRSATKYADRLSLAYSVWSDDRRSSIPAHKRLNLVYLHGAQLCKEIWTYHIKLAFKTWGEKLDKAIAIDFVGHGDSVMLNADKIGIVSPRDDQARDVGVVIRKHIDNGDIQGPVVLIGHSMGGGISLMASVLDAPLIDGLVLFDPYWRDPAEDWLQAELGKMYIAFSLRTKSEFANWQEYETYVRKRFARDFHPDVTNDILNSLGYKLPDGTVRLKVPHELRATGVFSPQSLQNLSYEFFNWVRQPTLILDGEQQIDRGLSNEQLTEYIKGAEYVIVENGSHNVAFEKPDEMFEQYRSFVEKVLETTDRKWVNKVEPNLKQWRANCLKADHDYFLSVAEKL